MQDSWNPNYCDLFAVKMAIKDIIPINSWLSMAGHEAFMAIFIPPRCEGGEGGSEEKDCGLL